MALFPCPECGRAISDRALACPNCACPVRAVAASRAVGKDRAPNAVGPDDLRVAGEKGALWLGIGILLFFMLLSLLFGGWLILPFILTAAAIVVWIRQGQLVGNAVKVSQQQFPEINEVIDTVARRLGMRRSEVFIRFDPTINATAIGFLAKKSVILHSALVEAMQLDELHQVIGHEFSHIKCGHTTLGVLTTAADIRVPVISQILSLVFLRWSRKAEYTCDRGGLIACRDPKAALSAMCKVAVGPELFKKMDIEHFLKQQMDLSQNDVARLSESLIDHPYLVRRIQAIEDFYASSQYKELTARNH